MKTLVGIYKYGKAFGKVNPDEKNQLSGLMSVTVTTVPEALFILGVTCSETVFT